MDRMVLPCFMEEKVLKASWTTPDGSCTGMPRGRSQRRNKVAACPSSTSIAPREGTS
jgi:hypothetical protein